jgi:hypothetical protein
MSQKPTRSAPSDSASCRSVCSFIITSYFFSVDRSFASNEAEHLRNAHSRREKAEAGAILRFSARGKPRQSPVRESYTIAFLFRKILDKFAAFLAIFARTGVNALFKVVGEGIFAGKAKNLRNFFDGFRRIFQ